MLAGGVRLFYFDGDVVNVKWFRHINDMMF